MEEDPPGTFFRWTAGRASFFVPADATAMTLPLRSVFPGPGGGPVTVDVRVDDRWLATVELTDPAEWVRPELPLDGGPAFDAIVESICGSIAPWDRTSLA